MKIHLEKYNPDWQQSFDQVKIELVSIIGALNPHIEHIGSTSVEGLSAKPIIDILVGLKNEKDLEKVADPLMRQGYCYYEIYNATMPYRRFFTRHKTDSHHAPGIIKNEEDVPASTEEHNQRLAHIHILTYGSEHWIRHIAFRDYLRAHLAVKDAYQDLKSKLSDKEWKDGNDYNGAKDIFIKTEEAKAINWYEANKQVLGDDPMILLE
ncbi:GrpB family protein [Chryseobacterium vrystaatense]|uniref:GrpB family protein n=1 Tax=Chryseobacterium vrystaatense TaxID=307480 RepID=UPI0006906851|nr:GrpB family protein [Chryseobacterium vrystaatense]